ncbi:hypothetical protein NDU88_000267 [Pleurodeles waltl]|uniref:Uncharacterized protein n=1 Tax=Pleurodeles waltl TaxID=8319 RepID=A0AAV7S558_PLEWA|nr:hypothetical protein NDU88_000267 [Pleurodeles waltl]
MHSLRAPPPSPLGPVAQQPRTHRAFRRCRSRPPPPQRGPAVRPPHRLRGRRPGPATITSHTWPTCRTPPPELA